MKKVKVKNICGAKSVKSGTGRWTECSTRNGNWPTVDVAIYSESEVALHGTLWFSGE